MAKKATPAKKRSSRRNATPKLTQRGVAVVSLVVAGTVATLAVLAANGHGGAALLGAFALYQLFNGGVARIARVIPTAREAFRGLCWMAVALVVLLVAQGTSAPGGAPLGLALAAALVTALKLTRNGRRQH